MEKFTILDKNWQDRAAGSWHSATAVSSKSSHLVLICEKSHWNPSTKYRDIVSRITGLKLTNNRWKNSLFWTKIDKTEQQGHGTVPLQFPPFKDNPNGNNNDFKMSPHTWCFSCSFSAIFAASWDRASSSSFVYFSCTRRLSSIVDLSSFCRAAYSSCSLNTAVTSFITGWLC